MSLFTKFMVTVAAVAGTAFINPAFAKYPENTISVTVPTELTSGADVTARFLQRRVQESLGMMLTVDALTEEGGIKAVEHVKAGKPDGYTLLLTNSFPVARDVALGHKLPYDPVKDLTPLVKLSYNPMAVVVAKGSEIETVEQLVAAAKQSGSLSYGSANASAQVATELFLKLADVKAKQTSYDDVASALKALEEKTIDFMFADTDSLMTLAVTHPLRVIATTADKRYKHAPNAPTLQELGYKDYYMVDWLAIFGPAGMSEEAQKEASEALLTVYTEKRSLNFLERTNWEVFPGNYKELADFQKAEIQRWSEAAQQANLSQ